MSQPASLQLGDAQLRMTLLPVSALAFRDPNGDDLPLWPVYDQNEQYLKLDINISTGQRLKDRRVEFWTDTLPLILSASKALLSPAFSLILFSLLLSFLLSVAS